MDSSKQITHGGYALPTDTEAEMALLGSILLSGTFSHEIFQIQTIKKFTK